jgi:hypothetical protein
MGVDAKTKTPLGPNEEFPTIQYSQTKLIGNMLAMKFQEQNVIDLDE